MRGLDKSPGGVAAPPPFTGDPASKIITGKAEIMWAGDPTEQSEPIAISQRVKGPHLLNLFLEIFMSNDATAPCEVQRENPDETIYNCVLREVAQHIEAAERRRDAMLRLPTAVQTLTRKQCQEIGLWI